MFSRRAELLETNPPREAERVISTLKPYPAYKDSGVPWLGKVPAHWEVRRIKTLFYETDERNADGGGPLLSLTRARGIVPQAEASNRIASVEDLSNYKVCKPGDLIMNRMQAWSGMFAVSGIDGVISPDYSVFQPKAAIDVHYFEALFKTDVLVNEFAKRSKGIGSGFNRLYTPDFGDVPIASPPSNEQIAIVRFLDWAERRIRRVIRARQRRIKLLEEYRQALIHQAVTGRIDVRTGKPYPAYKESGVEWLGQVPEHWEVRRLKSAVAHINEQTSANNPDDLYIALEHVESWTGRLRAPFGGVEFDSQVKRFRAGDVLFGKLRPYLAKVVRPQRHGVCVGEFFVLRASHAVTPPYLEVALRSALVIDYVNSATYGAKMPRADWAFVGNLPFPLPPLPEQTAIVEFLDAETAKIDAAIAADRRSIELLQQYRTRLIANVVTGKVDVREAAAKLPDEPPEEEAEWMDGDEIAEGEVTDHNATAEVLSEEEIEP